MLSPDSLLGSITAPGQQTKSRPLTWPVLAWGLWDWGSAAFNAVITTFVFATYLVSSSFGDPTSNQSRLSAGMAVAGLLIALLAPVTGQRADRAGRAVASLGVYTALVVAVSAALFFVKPEPGYLWLGIVLMGVGNLFFELASVNYNGLLSHVTSKERIGAVSGIGWGMGYLGGIVLLLVVYAGLISPEVGWFGVTSADGLNVRVAMLVAAAWFGISAIPVLLTQSSAARRRRRRQGPATGGPEADGASRIPGRGAEPVEPGDIPGVGGLAGAAGAGRHESILASYRHLWRTLRSLYRSHPNVLRFLLASAIFRDGLAGVFAYGGIVARTTFDFSDAEVIQFAVAANVVAGITTIACGRLDDIVGPRRVIMGSLVILVVAGNAVFFLHDGGKAVFWALGLALSACVGPAQSASRTFLARLIPEGREGEIFGLYATTGRAASFLAPALYGAAIWVGARFAGQGSGYWGILGIMTVLIAGLVLMAGVKDPDGHLQHLA
ncbi:MULTISPECIES: MFS transporter [Actinomyces]|uniref:MFS transporter n=1 Tax=Actinomyces TaxID=1654 RepID=UPI00135BA7B2|nr:MULTISPECIES: MFS transporter [Actinomyces]